MLRKPEELSSEQISDLISYLKLFKSEERIQTYEKVLNMRTRHITVLMENIDHPHNISAVLRNCDCFGIQDVYLVDDKADYSVNKKVAMGASKWLNLYRYYKNDNNSLAALQVLKEKGYRLVATTPAIDACPLTEFKMDNTPVAFIFGTELTGISPVALEMAETSVTIPMAGFTESLNLSVSVAIILQNITRELRLSGIDWQLTEQEKMLIMLDWLRKTTPKIELIETRFFNK